MAIFIYAVFIKQVCDSGGTLCVIIDSFFLPTYSSFVSYLPSLLLCFNLDVISSNYTFFFSSHSSACAEVMTNLVLPNAVLLQFLFWISTTDLFKQENWSWTDVKEKQEGRFHHLSLFSTAERSTVLCASVMLLEWRSDCMSRHTRFFLRFPGVHVLA